MRIRHAARSTAFAVLLGCAPLAAAGQSSEGASPFKKNPDPPASAAPQGFSVVLLLGDLAPGADSQETIPSAARRALVDMKDFLPYKSYRLLDSQWMLCCGGSTPAITRLRGVDEQEYELELRPTLYPDMRGFGGGASELSMRFVLRDSEPASKLASDRRDKTAVVAAEARIAQLNQEIFALEREHLDLKGQLATLNHQVEVGIKDPAEKKRVSDQFGLVSERLNVLKKELNLISGSKYVSDARPVIDTSFRMKVGETVVVGTSRLKGGTRALIAVLTAVGPRKDAGKETVKK